MQVNGEGRHGAAVMAEITGVPFHKWEAMFEHSALLVFMGATTEAAVELTMRKGPKTHEPSLKPPPEPLYA